MGQRRNLKTSAVIHPPLTMDPTKAGYGSAFLLLNQVNKGEGASMEPEAPLGAVRKPPDGR